jgi:hypothetical protein
MLQDPPTLSSQQILLTLTLNGKFNAVVNFRLSHFGFLFSHQAAGSVRVYESRAFENGRKGSQMCATLA